MRTAVDLAFSSNVLEHARPVAAGRRAGPGDPARRHGLPRLHALVLALGRARDLAVALPRRAPGAAPVPAAARPRARGTASARRCSRCRSPRRCAGRGHADLTVLDLRPRYHPWLGGRFAPSRASARWPPGTSPLSCASDDDPRPARPHGVAARRSPRPSWLRWSVRATCSRTTWSSCPASRCAGTWSRRRPRFPAPSPRTPSSRCSTWSPPAGCCSGSCWSPRLPAGLGAARLVPAERLLTRVAAAVGYAWTPFLAERLLLGQWGLLLAYAALPWLVRRPSACGRAARGAAAAGPGRGARAITPTGGFIALATTLVLPMAPHRSRAPGPPPAGSPPGIWRAARCWRSTRPGSWRR